MRRRKLEDLWKDPICFNCGADPEGRRLVTIDEAVRFCRVSRATIYRWMELRLIDWIFLAGGRRRIYKDSLCRPGRRKSPGRSP